MRTISLIPNKVSIQKDLCVLSEAIMERNEEIFNSKLLLHESFNDGYQLRNIDAVALAIVEYTDRMKDIISKEKMIIDNIFRDLGKTACDIDNLVLNKKIIEDKCDDRELSKVKFKMYNYNVNTKLIQYIDIDDMISTYRKDSLDGISDNELNDLRDNKDEFISYAMSMASEIGNKHLDMSNYRDELRKFLRGNSSKEEYTLSRDNLNMLFNILDRHNSLEDYLKTEYDRLCRFIDTIMNFADSVNHNELLQNAMNPNVSTNRQNWKMDRYSTRSDSFEIVRDYLVTLFDIFNKCIDIYTITISENAIIIKDMITDACNIITIVMNMKKNDGELQNTTIDSVCNSEYYAFESESIDTINECILTLSTFKVQTILNESVGVLQEAGFNKNKLINELSRIKDRIIQLSNSFRKLSIHILDKNKVWYDTIKSINVDSIKNAKIESVPFYDNFNKVLNIKVPEFNPNDMVYDSTSPDLFYKKYYVGLDTKNNLSNLFNQLMANDKQIQKSNGGLAINVYKKCVTIIDGYKRAVDRIYNENKRLSNQLTKYTSSSMNESVSSLLDMNIFHEDYYYELFDDDNYETLMEAAGDPVTPDSVGSVDNPTKNSINDNNNISKQVTKYVTWSYAVQAIRMRAIDKMYTNAVNIIMTIAKSRKAADNLIKDKTKVDKNVDNQEKNK